MNLTLGFSPCPNDTYIFDALVNGRLDTGPLRFDPVLADVQTLNEWALAGRLDVSKISFGVLPRVADRYALLDAGSALGVGVGPLLVGRRGLGRFDPATMKVAIPGRDTTAHLLFSLAFPEASRKTFLLFSAIEDAVLSGDMDAGVIIHESRFTYAAKGLVKLLDLGEHWERETRSPVPLGGIVARRSLDAAVRGEVDRLIRRSLELANTDRATLSGYVRRHAQEMDPAVMRQHVDLYVNDFSLGLGDAGRRAVERLLAVYRTLNPTAPVGRTELFGDPGTPPCATTR
jgi:1,4-dihydroxy-6-naphthoate synthase